MSHGEDIPGSGREVERQRVLPMSDASHCIGHRALNAIASAFSLACQRKEEKSAARIRPWVTVSRVVDGVTGGGRRAGRSWRG